VRLSILATKLEYGADALDIDLATRPDTVVAREQQSVRALRGLARQLRYPLEDLQRLVLIRGIAQPVCGKDVCANEAHELLVMRVCNPMA